MDFTDVVASVKQAVVAIGICPSDTGMPVHLSVGETDEAKLPAILGTGFCIHEVGLIVTCQHVIDGLMGLLRDNDLPIKSAIAMFTLYEQDGTAQLVGIPCKSIFAPGADIALIELEHFPSQLPTICIGKDLNVVVGEEIAVCGYPLGNQLFFYERRFAGVTSLIQKGIISAILPSEFGDIRNELVIGAPVFKGYSGSPVFRTDSPEVVGIVKAIATTRLEVAGDILAIPLPNTAYAIPGQLMAEAINLGLGKLKENG